MDNQGQKEFKTGKGYLYEKNARPLPKFMKGIMVAGGLSYKGVSKLIFVTGTMTSISYLQSLKYYKEDIERLDRKLFFQHDNAPCHVSKKCLEYLNTNFENKLKFWPANSPDFSPIEELWSLVQEKLNKYTFENTEEMARKLNWIWNRIPKKICRHLISSFDKKVKLAASDGERVNKREHQKYKPRGDWINNWNSENKMNYVERIVYNKNVLDNMKKSKIKELKSKIKEIKQAFKEKNLVIVLQIKQR